MKYFNQMFVCMEIFHIFAAKSLNLSDMEKKKSVFETLNAINVNGKTEKKNGLTYLSWAFAWGEIKKNYPNATYTIYENANGMNYHTDGRTAWVKTGVTIEGIEYIEYLPVMDYRNQSITIDKITSFNVNTAIQRSLTKACARHGLGLYIYAGEDLPEEEKEEQPAKTKPTKPKGNQVINAKDDDGLEDAYIIMKPQIETCGSIDELTMIWKKSDERLRMYEPYKTLVAARNRELSNK